MKNEKSIKIVMGVLIFLIILLVAGVAVVKAEDNKTTRWNTQLVYDTVNGCYEGTYRWIVIANPALIGQTPPPMIQRQMVIHCFCVLDKVRAEFPFKKYIKLLEKRDAVGDLFMKKAYECIDEFDTMRGIIIMQDPSDNATKPDNGTIEKLEVLPAVPEGPEESSPDEKLEDQQTILQG